MGIKNNCCEEIRQGQQQQNTAEGNREIGYVGCAYYFVLFTQSFKFIVISGEGPGNTYGNHNADNPSGDINEFQNSVIFWSEEPGVNRQHDEGNKLGNNGAYSVNA